MADLKITELTAYTPAISTDLFPIVDITTTTTKKITVNSLLTSLPDSLISDTDSTDDLGSSSKYWANTYTDALYTETINGSVTNGNLSIIPNGSGHTIIGNAGTTSHTFNTNDDLLVSGRLEVNGVTYIDGGMFIMGDSNLMLSSTAGFSSKGSGQQTDELMVFTGDTDKYVLFTTYGLRLKDFDHAAQTNPTLFIHSATDPDTANTQWLSLTHDQTDAVIATGTGDIKLDGTVNITGNLEIDGVQVLTNRVIDARADDVANSGDATTDGVIDALRDAMITHGLIAAA